MSTDKKTTAVEWLFNQLPDHLRSSRDGFDMLRQASVMFEEQIIDAFTDGNRQEVYDSTETLGSQYYTETYINSPAIGGNTEKQNENNIQNGNKNS